MPSSSSSLQENDKEDGASSSSFINDTNSTNGSRNLPPPSAAFLEGNKNDEKQYSKDILMLTSRNYSEKSLSYHGEDGDKEGEDEQNELDAKVSAIIKTNGATSTELVRESTEEQASSATSHLNRQQPLRPGAFAMQGRSSNSSSSSHETAEDEAEAAREPTVLTSSISATTTTAEGDVLLNAIMVDKPEDVEAQVRNKIIKEAVQASAVVVIVDDDSKQHQQQADGNGDGSAIVQQNKWQRTRKQLLVVFIMVVVSIAIAVWYGVSRKDDSNNQRVIENDDDGDDVDVPQMLWTSTMDEIRKRGVVRCGCYAATQGLSHPNNVTGKLEGMNIDQCRAVALAIFNDSTKYEAIPVPFKERFTALTQNRSIDLHTGTHTMARDVYESKSRSDLIFSIPYLYTELAFVGYPEFVYDCADQMETYLGNCRNLRICVGKETTHEEYIQRYLPATFIVGVSFPSQLVTYLEEGKCNVIIIAEHGGTLPELNVRVEGYSGPYVLGNTRFAREPMSLIMRNEENPEFSDLVNTVLRLFKYAEAMDLTQDKAQEQELLMNLNEDEENLQLLMIGLVAEFGNYGEIWNRTMERFIPRNALNYIYENGIDNNTTMDSGLLFSYPFGDLEEQGPDPIPHGILEKVFQRGYLICGVIPRPGFAEFHIENKTWHGLDVEFCRALNAAIHMGETETVEFVDVSNTNERYSHLLANYTASGDDDGGAVIAAVDIIAGERVTIQNDIKELTTNMGYTFSIPYFYDNKGDAFAFVTNQSDSQWSDFVFWVVMATIYAEEEGISSQTDLTKMPTVNLFGQEFKQMFLDCIAAVGNYGEIYEHTLGGIIPRSGGNLLNGSPGGPQHFPMPID